MFNHIVEDRPSSKSGRKYAYSLRGVPRAARADLAVNGMPTLCPPYTSGQLAALHRVSRADLKRAHDRKNAPYNSTTTFEELFKALVRDLGTDKAWEYLVAIVNEQK